MKIGYYSALAAIILLFATNKSFSEETLWQKLGTLPEGAVQTVCVSPISGDVIANVFEKGLYKIKSDGTTIDLNASIGGKSVVDCAFAPNGDLYAGFNGAGIFKSTDEGASWTDISAGLTNLRVSSIFVSKRGEIFVGTWFFGSIWHSSNSGAEWIDLGPGNIDVTTVFMNDAGDLFAGAEYTGLYKKASGADTWVVSGFVMNDVYSIIEKSPGELYACSKNGLFFSSNSGADWAQRGSGMPSNYIRALVKISDDCLISAGESGVFKSVDRGANWMPFSEGIPGTGASAYKLAFTADKRLFVGCLSGLYFITDPEYVSVGENLVTYEAAYPNPAYDYCVVSCRPGLRSIEIIDAKGLTLQSLEIKDYYYADGRITLDLKNLASGIYIIKSNYSGSVSIDRISVAK